MKIGDCYILSSVFHQLDIGVIYLGETDALGKEDDQYLFAPINFPNHKFDNSEKAILESKLLVYDVGYGSSFETRIGLKVIHEFKRNPSFLIPYCLKNKPYTNLKLNLNQLALYERPENKFQIILGGGTGFDSRENFDKFNIQTLTRHHDCRLLDLKIILK